VLAGVLVTAAAAATELLAWPRPSCQQTLVPAYFYPGPGWSRAIRSRPPPRIMILDVTSSGAGNAPDRNYQAEVRRARAAGITVLGYTNTSYTARPAAAVETDVQHYRAWYDVTDIFLDEVSSGASAVGYYRRLAGYVHAASPGSLVMLNPGTYPDRQYMSIGDIVLVFENSYASYLRLHVPRWVRAYPAARFAQAIYATPRGQLARVITLSQRRHAGYVYVTGRTGANPYGGLPSYWAAEDAAIAAHCS
jgi:Spherulation-specific family 4